MTTLPNWSKLYSKQQIEAWRLPIQENPKESSEVQQPLIIWSEMSQRKKLPWFICCDVLQLDRELAPDRAAFIFARRIEVLGRGRILLDRVERNPGEEPELMIFTQEVAQPDQAAGLEPRLPILAVSGTRGNEEEVRYDLKASGEAGARGLQWRPGLAQPTSLDATALESAWVAEEGTLRSSLVTIFQIATLLASTPEQRPLARAQLRWVGSLAHAGADSLEMALQARLMLDVLDAESQAQDGAVVVPPFDSSVYAEETEKWMQLLRDLAARVDQLERRLADDANWLQNAEIALAKDEIQDQLANALEAQVREAFNRAEQARDIAVAQLIQAHTEVGRRRDGFVAGEKKWRLKQQTDNALQIVSNVLAIAAQIPTIVSLGPTAAGYYAHSASSLGTTIINIARGVATKAETPEEKKEREDKEEKAETKKEREEAKKDKAVAAIKAAGDAGAKIYNAVQKIIDADNQAIKMEMAATAHLAAVGKSVKSGLKNLDVQGIDVATGGAHKWESMRIEVEALFKQPYVMEVEGASLYHDANLNLIVCGKALSQARLAVADAASRLAEIQLRRNASVKTVTVAKQLKEKSADKIRRDRALRQLAFGRVLDAKRMLYISLEAHRRAFQYYTLAAESGLPQMPRLTDSYESFSRSTSEVAAKKLIVEALKPGPQTMGDIEVEFSNLMPTEPGLFQCPIPLDQKEFRPFARVRIDRLRVYAVGLETPEDVVVDIVSSGIFEDRTRDRTVRQFAAKAVHLRFVYSGADPKKIRLDGEITSRHRDDFFKPTPFTTWSVRVTSGADAKPFNENVNKLRFVFSGTAT